MKPEDLKTARKKLKLSRADISKNLEIGLRTYVQRENAEMPVGRMMEYALCWMLHRAGLDSVIKRLKIGGEKRS